MAKKQITSSIDEDIIKDMERLRDEAGIPVSTQIEIRLKGFTIIPFSDIKMSDRLDALEHEIRSLRATLQEIIDNYNFH